MNENDQEPNIQITPVSFGPPQEPEQAVGIIGPPPPRPPMQFTVFVPLAILLLTLNFTSVRDMIALNKRMTIMNAQNAPSLDILKKAAKQGEFIDSIRADLVRLAPTDPVAAQILKSYFPPTPASSSTDTSAPKDQTK